MKGFFHRYNIIDIGPSVLHPRMTRSTAAYEHTQDRCQATGSPVMVRDIVHMRHHNELQVAFFLNGLSQSVVDPHSRRTDGSVEDRIEVTSTWGET